MGRHRTELPAGTDERIVEFMTRGGTAESIHAALGVDVSKRTIARRMGELRGRVNSERAERLAAPESASELPATADEIPPGTDLTTFDVWLEKAERMAREAERTGNLVELGKAGRLVVMLLDAKRKATPVAAPDLNERPDMVAAARRARETLHKLVESAVGE